MNHTARVLGVLMLAAWLPARLRPAIPSVAVGLWSPPLGVAVAAAGPLRRLLGRWRGQRRIAAAAADQVDLLAELLVLGLSAGWGFAQALAWAAPRVGDPVRTEVDTVVRWMRHQGGMAALDGRDGHAAGLYRLVARAQATGAPLVEAVEAFAADRMAWRRQQTLAAARRLPVVLVFPLALLILPGFVLVAVAPALIGALQRIGS